MTDDAEFDGFSDVVRIGRGGLGHVYRARRDTTGATVALKVLHDVSDQSVVWKRTRRELSALVALDGHAHVIRLYDTLELPDAPVIVMEYAPNGSVAALLAERGDHLSPAECLLVARHTASALEAAHARGIVHRDIKPQNLLIDAYGQVKLCDFGIATLARSPEFQERTSAISMRYASPEDLEDDTSIGPPSDVYSLGATLLHLARGAPPSLRERLEPWRRPAFEADAAAGQHVVDEVLERCLQPGPADRPTAAELRELLDELDDAPLRAVDIDAVAHDASQAQSPSSAANDSGGSAAALIDLGDEPPLGSATVVRRPPPRPAPPVDEPTRRRWAAVVGAVCALAIGAGAWAVFNRPDDRPAAAPLESSEAVRSVPPTSAVVTTSTPTTSTTTTDAPTSIAPTSEVGQVIVLAAAPTGFASVDDSSWRWPVGEVGECLNRVEGAAVSAIEPVGCDVAHDVQRYGAGTIDTDEFDVIAGETQQRCRDAFVEFVFDGDDSVAATDLESFISQPSAASWAEGDRGYQCWLFVDDARIVGDAQNSRW